jgi:hypothetical protein
MKKYALLSISILFVMLIQMVVPVPTAQAIALQPVQWYTPLELDFGPVAVGATSSQRTVTITNSGSVPLTGWAGGGVPSPFSASQDCNITGGVLPGHTCHYYFTFSPTAAGTFSATSTSQDNAGPISIIIHGTGVGASATYDAHGLDFGDVFANARVVGTAPQQVVTIRNTGLAPLTDWAGGGVSAPFSASQDCNIAGGVLPGHSCHYYFDFSTNTDSTFTATSTSTTNGGTIVVNLEGKSHGVILLGGGQQVTPFSLDFGPVGVGNTSSQLVATITNHTTSNITGWAGGGVSAPFSASQDCNIAGGLPPGASCHYYFTFHPTSAGAFTANSNSADSVGNFSIQVQGTGVAPSLTANSLWVDFGPTAPIAPGKQQVITLTNTGLSNITGWAGGGVSIPFNGSQDCSVAGGLAPGASCHFYYTFLPSSPGAYSATSTISTNAGITQIKLQGTYLPVTRVYIPLVQH